MDDAVLAQLLRSAGGTVRVAAEPKDGRGQKENRGMTRFLSPFPEADANSETNIRSGVETAEAAAIRRSVMVSAARRWAQRTKEYRHAERADAAREHLDW